MVGFGGEGEGGFLHGCYGQDGIVEATMCDSSQNSGGR